MSRDRAAYMREYRKRTKERPAKPTPMLFMDRITELEEEVGRLKRELATRPTIGPAQRPPPLYVEEQFNSRPFTPVPKKR